MMSPALKQRIVAAVGGGAIATRAVVGINARD